MKLTVLEPGHFHADEFLRYVKRGSLPAPEAPNTLAKYYTTTAAVAIALGGGREDAAAPPR